MFMGPTTKGKGIVFYIKKNSHSQLRSNRNSIPGVNFLQNQFEK